MVVIVIGQYIGTVILLRTIAIQKLHTLHALASHLSHFGDHLLSCPTERALILVSVYPLSVKSGWLNSLIERLLLPTLFLSVDR